MSDEREFVSLDVAIGMLHECDPGLVHTFRQAGGMAIGARWDRESLIEAMRGSPQIEITGPTAQAMGHGLAIFDEHGILFIETRDPREVVMFAPLDQPPQEDEQ